MNYVKASVNIHFFSHVPHWVSNVVFEQFNSSDLLRLTPLTLTYPCLSHDQNFMFLLQLMIYGGYTKCIAYDERKRRAKWCSIPVNTNIVQFSSSVIYIGREMRKLYRLFVSRMRKTAANHRRNAGVYFTPRIRVVLHIRLPHFRGLYSRR